MQIAKKIEIILFAILLKNSYFFYNLYKNVINESNKNIFILRFIFFKFTK